MKLLTKEMHSQIPPIGSQESNKDPMVVAKFFMPTSQWTWFVIEGSVITKHNHQKPLAFMDSHPDDVYDVLFFGLVQGFERELGYFSLSELETVRDRFGIGVERDLHFQPMRLSEVHKKLDRR